VIWRPRRLARFVRADDAEDAAGLQAQVDRREAGFAAPRIGSGRPKARSPPLSRAFRQSAGRRPPRDPGGRSTQIPVERSIDRDPEQRLATGGREGSRLERHRPLLDLGQRAEDHRRREWHDASSPPPEPALSVHAAGALGIHDLSRALDRPRHHLDCRADNERGPASEAPAHQIGQQIVDGRRQVDEGNRRREGKEASDRLQTEPQPAPRGASGPSRAIGSLAPGSRKMLISRIEPTMGDAASAMMPRPRNRRATAAVARTAPRTSTGPASRARRRPLLPPARRSQAWSMG